MGNHRSFAVADMRSHTRGAARRRVDRPDDQGRTARQPARAHRPRLVLDSADDLGSEVVAGHAAESVGGAVAPDRGVAARVPAVGAGGARRHRCAHRQRAPGDGVAPARARELTHPRASELVKLLSWTPEGARSNAERKLARALERLGIPALPRLRRRPSFRRHRRRDRGDHPRADGRGAHRVGRGPPAVLGALRRPALGA